MLNKQDIKTIQGIVDNSIEKLTTEVLKPAFDSLAAKEDLDRIEQKLNEKPSIEDLDRLEQKLNEKPSIKQLDDRFDKMEQKIGQMAVEPSIKRDRKLNEKTNQVAEKLAKKKIFSSKDFREIKNITPVVNPAS